MSWWFDDAATGTVIAHPGGRTLADADQLWLAWVTNNASDLHGNGDAASRGPYGEMVVLGALTASIVIGLAQPGDVRAEELRWRPPHWRRIGLTLPVRVGDTLRAQSTIVSLGNADGSGGDILRIVRGVNQHGAVVVEIEEELRVSRRPPEEEQRFF